MNSKDKHKKRKLTTEERKCLFCGSNERKDVLKYGKMIKYNDLYVHYYCVLLSSGLTQKGADTEGVYGFLEKDILKEWKRGEKLRCSYCRTNGATIGCSVKTCKVSFHLPCGQKNRALNQFFDNFLSFCVKHRKLQTLDSNDDINDDCPTCYTNIKFDGGINVLVTPCCHKLCHRLCLQKQALSAGYFFKCPLCNNKEKFLESMNEFGVYVPNQDASWETDNNAFRELYQRHSRCDQKKCVCPEGREHKDESNWQLLICGTCGSKGTHWTCRVGQVFDEWICDECERVDQRVTYHSGDSRAVHSEDSESDIEIISTVENNENKLMNATIKLSNNSNQLFEISVSGEPPQKKVKRLKPETKDVAIQCTLVAAKDLVDSEPFEDLAPHVFKDSIITLSSIKKCDENEIIDIGDSDDEVILLN